MGRIILPTYSLVHLHTLSCSEGHLLELNLFTPVDLEPLPGRHAEPHTVHTYTQPTNYLFSPYYVASTFTGTGYSKEQKLSLFLPNPSC